MPIQKEIPWCTAFLCGMAILCHLMVLIGNLKTSAAVHGIGSSIKGWSDVGLGVAEALHEELDELLSNVTSQLTDAINRTIQTQEMIDNVLAMMGGTAATAGATALQRVALLQSDGHEVGNPFGMIMDFVSTALKQLPNFQQALTSLQAMMENLKPALMQVGIWVETFADKVQATVETFGTTMDRVQKIFDSLMSRLSSDAGENADVMQHETFNLFDVDASGQISEDDLQNCADLYAMNALKGEKGKELIEKYDSNGDGEIDLEEFPLLVEDESIVGIMAVVLRAYAKRLSMVSGNVAAARMRDEVASNVVKYFQLVCSKNLTKVGWVSDMLTNGTLPLPFTADVMAELALQRDDPNVLTTADVGELVIGMMMTINSDYTMSALDLMSSAEHWETEGFDEDDQPDCVEQVTKWTQSGPNAIKQLEQHMIALEKRNKRTILDEESLLGEDTGRLDAVDEDLLQAIDAMPAVAKRLATERMRKHAVDRWKTRAQKRVKLFGTEAKRVLLKELLHGLPSTDDAGIAILAEQALSKGVPARPETLLFAKWLSANATQTADRFQAECFEYTGESSSALDAFNTQIQGMVKKISMFINMMKKYATTSGIQHMEDIVDEFASNGLHDVFMIVKDLIVDALEGATGGHNDTNKLLLLEENASASNVSLLDFSARQLSSEHLNAAAASLLRLAGPDHRVGQGGPDDPFASSTAHFQKTHGANRRVSPKAEVLAGGKVRGRGVTDRRHSLSHRPPNDLAGVWDQVATTLREMEKVLPTAIELLKFSRKEVSAVAANLDSIFETMGTKGKKIFNQTAETYAAIWGAYFFLVFTVTFGILMYAFWASGWFGGPEPVSKKMVDYEPPRSFVDRVRCSWDACCRCCVYCHDTQSCFWSCIILFQVFLLVLFIMSIVFTLLAGIQMFMGSSCAQIYILGDLKVCTETLDQLSTFLATFQVGEGEVPLSMSCDHHSLLTCDLIHDDLLMAGMMTVAGSFVAVVFSFELIFAIAMIHERAIWRRVINEIEMEKEEAKAEARA